MTFKVMLGLQASSLGMGFRDLLSLCRTQGWIAIRIRESEPINDIGRNCPTKALRGLYALPADSFKVAQHEIPQHVSVHCLGVRS
jgi:hypothetical protein